MQIHLSDISSSEGKSQHYSVAFEMDTITFQQGTFPVLAKEPVELTITNTGVTEILRSEERVRLP